MSIPTNVGHVFQLAGFNDHDIDDYIRFRDKLSAVFGNSLSVSDELIVYLFYRLKKVENHKVG